MKIGLLGDELLGWMGGRVYFKALYLALSELSKSDNFSFTVFAASSCKPMFNAGADLDYVKDAPVFFTSQHDLGQLSCAAQIDCLLPFIYSPGPDFSVRWLGYIYDFQHYYLPQHFQRWDIYMRKLENEFILRHSAGLIVNSQSVAKHASTLFPNIPTPTFAMPIIPTSLDPTLISDPEIGRSIRAKYKISNPFFIVCNQFWKHKDHWTAFKAFDAFAAGLDGGTPVELICTGATEDIRDRYYFENLMRQCESLPRRNKIRILGLLPRQDQLALVVESLAVIQPTHFEGGPGGGAVSDSMALGVESIVSDIDVNKELSEEPSVNFFRVGDSVSLAQTMRTIFENRKKRPTLEELHLINANRLQRLKIALKASLLQGTKKSSSAPLPLALRLRRLRKESTRWLRRKFK